MFDLVFVALVWLLSIGGVIAIMNAKGRPEAAAVLGITAMVFGPFAFFFALMLERSEEGLRQKKLSRGTYRVCESCAELVRREAVKCRYCSSPLGALAASAHPTRPPVELTPEQEARMRPLSKRAAAGLLAIVGVGVLWVLGAAAWDFADSFARERGYRLVSPVEWWRNRP